MRLLDMMSDLISYYRIYDQQDVSDRTHITSFLFQSCNNTILPLLRKVPSKANSFLSNGSSIPSSDASDDDEEDEEDEEEDENADPVSGAKPDADADGHSSDSAYMSRANDR